MKKIITLILALALTLSMSTAASAAELLSFRDVPSTHWAYKDIMRSVELGLVQGTKAPDENGVGEFDPDGMMTVAQFITVVVRAVEPGQEFDKGDSTLWYAGTWNEAVNLGILGKNDFGGVNGAKASKAITREEMAYVITNALDYMGEKPDQIVDVSRVPDLGEVSAAYRNEVLNVYSLGIICGINDAGTFSPGGVLTRAQASAVMNRILDKDSRKKVEFGKVPSAVSQTVAGVQTWVEGQSHSKPKAGDIVIKSDGTKVVLKVGYGGVLGAGQGVDIYSGFVNVDYSVTGVNASGFRDGSPVLKDNITGETHTKDEWVAIQASAGPRNSDGTAALGSYTGEVRNTWFTWNGFMWESSIPRQ